MPLPLKHLTAEDHAEAARLVNRIQRDLQQLARLISRREFTDQVLRVQKNIQETLIDPLCEDKEARFGRDESYPSIGYWVGR